MTEERSIGKLVSIIYRYSHIYFQKQFSKFNIGYGQIPILMFIAKNDNVTLKTVTENFKIDKGTTSSLVRKLENNEYIKRKKNLNDRREFNLRISNKAEKIVPEIMQSRKEWTNMLLKGFKESEMELAFDFLSRMVDNVEFLKQSEKDNE